MKRSIAVKALLIPLLLCAGCASSARVGEMAASPEIKLSSATPLRESVGVKSVSGGQDTNPLWKSKIGNDEFRGALETSLKSAGLLEKARDEGRYSLGVVLENVEQPNFGFSTTVKAQVKYTLTDKKTGKDVFQESVVGEYTATMSDSFYGPKRLQIANEGAARDNIEKLTKKLFQLSLSP